MTRDPPGVAIVPSELRVGIREATQPAVQYGAPQTIDPKAPLLEIAPIAPCGVARSPP
ncbi:hypothetical protein ABR738_06375 [Streptomyces sp. Edi4]|uniref:hypothetical protein n=1 Tax=Streptomyces sp. Edi4 TaxID=3162527 RepID=UPI0033056679